MSIERSRYPSVDVPGLAGEEASSITLVLALDTGPVHIARAIEVPVIGLYGHTNPWRVAP